MAKGFSRTQRWGSRLYLLAIVAGFAFAGTDGAQAQQPPTFRCRELPINPDPDLPKIAPVFRSTTDLSEDEFDCMAWQDFIYLIWPATPGQRGVPNPQARLGASGPTVWETYKTDDTVFLPNGTDPGPWDQPQLMATLHASLAQEIASGAVRHLTTTSKVSRAVLSSLLRNGAAIPPAVLDGISQAGGGTLYDLNGNPVYYEVSMDKVQYDYIVQHQLYNAYKQVTFARDNVIILPGGVDAKTPGAVEIKAAWKVLTDTEKKSGRFHTIQALLGGSQTPITVGLVGFHAFIATGGQGAWATFAQTDNAPIQPVPTTGTFNFFNPKCTLPGTTTPCPFNVKDADPGQVVQITPNAAAADKLNAYVHYILKQYDPKTPWQYYNLVDVQWPTSPVQLSTLKAPASAPLPTGAPNVATLVNAVEETFLQKPNMSCFTCHQYATTAATGINQPPYATSYSFMFGHATALPTETR
jgi:hypothetical protein